MSDVIKICPWCSKKPMIIRDDVDGFSISCENVDCTVKPYTQEYDTKAQATKAWNQRIKDVPGKYGSQRKK